MAFISYCASLRVGFGPWREPPKYGEMWGVSVAGQLGLDGGPKTTHPERSCFGTSKGLPVVVAKIRCIEIHRDFLNPVKKSLRLFCGIGMTLEQLTEKKERLRSYDPIPRELVYDLDEWLEAQFTYHSNAISGNSLSRVCSVMVMDQGITSSGKLRDHLEAANMSQALDSIVSWVQQQPQPQISSLEEKDILSLHSLLMEGIDDQNAGRYREVNKKVYGSCVVLPKPEEIPELMDEFVTWLGKDQASHPVYWAAQAHFRFLIICPFDSGNGSLARLLMNLILISLEYPTIYIDLEDRPRYFRSLEQAYLGDQSNYLSLVYEAADRSLENYLYGVESFRRA